jgi:hypothetical protein
MVWNRTLVPERQSLSANREAVSSLNQSIRVAAKCPASKFLSFEDAAMDGRNALDCGPSRNAKDAPTAVVPHCARRVGELNPTQAAARSR